MSPGIRVPREYFSDLKKKLVPTLKTQIIERRRLFISWIFMHPDDAYLGSRLIKDPVILFFVSEVKGLHVSNKTVSKAYKTDIHLIIIVVHKRFFLVQDTWCRPSFFLTLCCSFRYNVQITTLEKIYSKQLIIHMLFL